MKSNKDTPIAKRLVLLGGGHSHLAVLMRLARKPLPGLGVTLVSRDIETPYSGSLAGYLAGFYHRDQMHIDLRPLAQMAGVRLIHAQVESLDLANRVVPCPGRPPIHFDILSINTGSGPDCSAIPGAAQFATPVKPMDIFLHKWELMLARLDPKQTIAIIGGGPASVELALATRQRLDPEGHFTDSVRILLVSNDKELLQAHNSRVRRRAMEELTAKGVEVRLQHRVVKLTENTILCQDREPIRADFIYLATGAGAADWPGKCGLAVNEAGFIQVNSALQSISHDCIFAAGDIAEIQGHSRPKSGVYAVRQGKPLAENLLRYAAGRKLKRHKPQREALALISTGDEHAIASRGNLYFHGRWVWRLKDHIDRGFVDKYNRLPPAPEKQAPRLQASGGDLDAHAMRCSGCGAKVGGSILNEVLDQLDPCSHEDILSHRGGPEDAAIIRLRADRSLVQTVDHFRAFINDPYTFAKVASNHCLSDIHAMGAVPHSALAIVSIPYAARDIMREQLREIMTGCTEVLNDHGTALIGGHSNESAELSFGLSVNGFAVPRALLRKGGVQTGDSLILCKPLGTGTLFAADGRWRARGRWIEAAIAQMLISNREAAKCFTRYRASACTDITGFGLAGHLLEMLRTNNAEAELSLAALPLLSGAAETLAGGIVSSIQAENKISTVAQISAGDLSSDPLYPVLFDPQTAGGLLAAVPAGQVPDCLRELTRERYKQAAVIGKVRAVDGVAATIHLTNSPTSAYTD